MSEKKILIVDDEPSIVLSLDYLMRKNGFKPFIARNGEEALTIAESEIPELVILDIMMPGMDGYEVCEKLKSNPLTQSTKIIFLSAKSGKEAIEKGMSVGADKYLTKPFNTKQIMQEVMNLLQ
ncbi:response regulator [Crocinitomicaceae bacterium CZZ-1]|uniref:Response regulator n=1 Tax=Taishania pollutisoli TaxID=2766479 RepID=A0A8J6PRN1_9FLAO|nr:response regulator [Taishania pollutisoli]MBC9813413.1 response regulator [Taishania pollutisoli]MBX2950700.1 response regulator [Crocinitomicaceae bacterium]NGF76569.1 response regulator [Fluviicola sp. SGL-29]